MEKWTFGMMTVAQHAMAAHWTNMIDRSNLSDRPIRDVLRSVTHAVHQRLHIHVGLAAVEAGTIDREAYTQLLCRLYGFHQPFEARAQNGADRTNWLTSDLVALRVDAASLARLPVCADLSTLTSPEQFLGARYVVEGSALGGLGLARQLDHLFGAGVMAGRQFFSGHGAEAGHVWRSYLAELSAASPDPIRRAAIISGAISTFAIFEQWLEGWTDWHA